MLLKVLSALLCLVLWVHFAECLGCISKICSANPQNDLRACPDADGTCGTFNGKRRNNELVKGVDVKCKRGASIQAPFAGRLYFWRPFGGRANHECADKGVRIEGTGQWQGYLMQIAFVDPARYGNVEKNDTIGVALDLHCLEDYKQEQRHIQIRLYKRNKPIDPTFHLRECMCTGRICESNRNNELVPSAGSQRKAQHYDERYNGVFGWELQCNYFTEDEDPEIDPEDRKKRIPKIYSPIDGRIIGRIRLSINTDNKYQGCDNEGLLIVGSGKWTDFTVRLYNVKYAGSRLGHTDFKQGDEVGERLDCQNRDRDTIFMEMRKNGKLVNATAMILGDNCQIPKFE